MHYIRIAKENDYKSGDYTVHSLVGKKIGLFFLEGQFKAMEILCKHQGAMLLKDLRGRIDSHILTCPRHGWQYDISSGACVTNDSVPLKHYPVDVRNGEVYIGFEFG